MFGYYPLLPYLCTRKTAEVAHGPFVYRLGREIFIL